MGFELDLWDYLTFLTLFLVVVAAVAFWVWLAGLPGRIAIRRKHPDAEAVQLLGWAGLLPTIYPWAQALIWAFKPTDKVDIRRMPRAEAKAEAEMLAALTGKAPPTPPAPYAPPRATEGPKAAAAPPPPQAGDAESSTP